MKRANIRKIHVSSTTLSVIKLFLRFLIALAPFREHRRRRSQSLPPSLTARQREKQPMREYEDHDTSNNNTSVMNIFHPHAIINANEKDDDMDIDDVSNSITELAAFSNVREQSEDLYLGSNDGMYNNVIYTLL